MTDRLAELGALQYAVENLSTAGTNPNRIGLAGYIHAAYTDYQVWAAANPGVNPNRLSARGRLYGYFYDNASWSPSSLFANSEVGAWYDPNDWTTLYQDNAGATPVTSVGQSVGMMLDKSGNDLTVTQSVSANRPRLYGQPTGSNLCTNPMFLSGTGWTAGSGWTLSAPQANAVTASGTLDYAFTPVVGKDYLVRFSFGNRTAGSISISLGGVTSGALSNAASTLFSIIRATSTAQFSFISTGFTGKVYGLEIFDISTNADCKAPYFLYNDGINDWLSGSNNITAYPFTLAWAGTYFTPSTIPSAVCLYSGDTDFKALDTGQRGLDWKEGVTSSYWSFGSLFDNTSICDFTSSANIAENQFIQGSSVANTNTFGTKATLYVGRSRDAFPMFGITRGVLIINRILTAQEKISLNEYYCADNPIVAWGNSMVSAQSGAMGMDGPWTTRLRTQTNKWTLNKGAGGETSTQIKDRFVANRDAEKRWTNIFWMGENDNYTGDYSAWKNTMLSNINTCIAGLLGNKRYIVLGITQVEGTDRPLDALDVDMAAAYGSRFLNIRSYLESKNDGSANDLADIAANLVPRSLRADTIHLNDLGNQYVANAVYEKLVELGCA